MNKSYRLVFNRAKGVIQAVAEIARANCKNTRTATVSAAPDAAHGTAPFARNVLVLAVTALFAGLPVYAQAAAGDGTDGTDQGNSSLGGLSDYGGGAGGAGGSNVLDWINLGNTQPVGGGGSGGAGSSVAGGFAGGTGGAGGNSGGIGGAGGVAAGSTGSAGGTITVTNISGNDYAGAGAGGGGAAGTFSATGSGLPAAPIVGGAGGDGGSTVANPLPAYGGGGGGGGGGTGLILVSPTGASVSLGYDVTGGNGGAGGAGNSPAPGALSDYNNAGGGGGGAGGAGVFAQKFSVTNNGGISLRGGDGGAGGYGAGDGGAGGAGGAGVIMAPVSGTRTLTNYGSISGGAGGGGGDTGGGTYNLFGIGPVSLRTFQAGAGGAGGNAVTVQGNGNGRVLNYSSLQGGNGGNGGNSTSYNYAGNGGNGGAGGHGIQFGTQVSPFDRGFVYNSGGILGGQGGAGGTATESNFTGVSGSGGAGGDGIRFSDGSTNRITVQNSSGTIAGGQGGAGATAPVGSAYINGGHGGTGGAGVNLLVGNITINNSGSGAIQGGLGGNGGAGYTGGNGGLGGVGISVSGGYATITNDPSATISGGDGGQGAGHSGTYTRGGGGGAGGAAVDFRTSGNTFNNYGSVQGGNGGTGGTDSNGGAGGAGVATGTAGGITITNDGSIRGGAAGTAGNYTGASLIVVPGATGGAGVLGGVFSLHNGTYYGGNITGGTGGQGAAATNGRTTGGSGGIGGAGVVGVANFDVSNGTQGYSDSTITGGVGGVGGAGPVGGSGGMGGAGISFKANGSYSAVITNGGYGVITGGVGGAGGVGSSGAGGAAGAGGAGGAGILIDNSVNGSGRFYNNGQITGGNGGAGGTGTTQGAGGAAGAGIEIKANGTADLIQNNAYSAITGGNGGAGSVGGAGGAGVLNQGTITALSNSGTIQGGTGNGGAAGGAGIENRGLISTLTNMGVIVGGGTNAGINNQSAIGTLINAQGGNASSPVSTALSFTGVLQGPSAAPMDYQIYITSATQYGQLALQSVTGGLMFGIASGSNLQAMTYTDVLSGIGSSRISNYSSIYNQWTTFGAYRWELVNGASCAPAVTCWDLAIAALPVPTDILSGQTYNTADLVSGSGAANVNPVFDGGTLLVSVPSTPGATVTVADPFTVSGNGGSIDQNGQNSTFSGVISDAVIGTPGSLTIANSSSGGMVSLTAVNTYTGSTTINTGATLALAGSGSIAASSGVVDNGVLDVSAVTTAGGPVIQSLSGSGVLRLGPRTLTLTNASGTFSGNVTGTGGRLVIASGTETLTGSNTHTGGIEVDAGAALSINAASNLGSGMLDLIGSSSTTATLNVLGTTTINNTIRIAGDPTFNIAGGTTTTIAAPIVDLGVPGDVVVAGTGTLNLTAANTYTGQTTISNGATLALNGMGSIANSSSVTNNGTFNVAGATGNVSLNSFTQGVGGNLVMSFAPTSNQQINVTGAATLGGGLTLNPVAGAYTAGRYTLLTATGGVTGTFSSFSSGALSSYTSLQYTLSYDANDVFLNLYRVGPSVQNTMQSVQNNAAGLASVINLQSAGLQAGLQYDCTKFAESNLCISAGGRYTYSGSGPSSNAEAGLVVIGYQPSAHWRVGGFVDQSVSNSTPSNFKLSNNSPVWGLFGNWYMNKDQNGLNVQGALAFSNNKLSTTRGQLTDTESGQGSTTSRGQGYQLQANYVQPLTDSIKAIPYLGLRYTQVSIGAYAELANSQVTSPLSYDETTQRSLSALAGVGMSARLADRFGASASVGAQKNLSYSMSSYSGTSQIAGLETFSARMPGRRDNLATASASLYYDLGKNERVGLNVLWQQQPFVNTNTASAMVTYTLGL